ncbi:MAG TPA: hypothetical protein VJQ25_09200, partial [Nitrospira sp.]|nr:hypothetical protein [Nitrospira sp.]
RADGGHGRHLQFICTIGHTFSPQDLYQAKEEQVEQAQWSLIVLLKHVQMIGGVLLESERQGDSYLPEDLRRRLLQVVAQIELIERTVKETEWPQRIE